MRRLGLPALLGVALLASCAEPTGQAPGASRLSPDVNPTGCISIDSTRALGRALYVTAAEQRDVNNRITRIRDFMSRGRVADARGTMFGLVKQTIAGWYAGTLQGGASAQTQAQVVTFINGLYCLAGLAAPNVPLSALGEDGVVAVIDPTSPATTVVTPSEFAGVQVPAAAAPTTTLLAVFRLPNEPRPLFTPLDQYPAFYEFQVSPVVTFTSDVVVGVCQADDFAPPEYGRLRVAHNVGNGIEILPLAPAPFLDCTSLLTSRNGGPSLFRLARSGWRVFESAFFATPAYASVLGTCCLGGSTKSFSPFGAVDTATSMDGGLSPSHITGPANSAVPASQLPTVAIVTPTGQPVPGVTVTFSIPQGSEGSLTGAVQVTDQSGVARLGGWTLGPGQLPNTVTAVGTPLPGTSIAQNSRTFTATVQ